MADENKNPLRVQRYEDLTNTEIVGILEGTRLDRTGQHNEALRALMVGLDCEHFISTLDLDPAKLTPDQRDEVLDLRGQLQAITGQFVPLNILGEVGGRQLADSLIAQRSAQRAAADAQTPSGHGS